VRIELKTFSGETDSKIPTAKITYQFFKMEDLTDVEFSEFQKFN
jgi:hypothetical protein